MAQRGDRFLLGAGFAGSGAGELVSEAVLGIEVGASTTDVALSIHPHPTLSETVMEAAEVYLGRATHVIRKRRKSLLQKTRSPPT